MFFSDEIRRTAHERIDRFHREAEIASYRPSFRRRAAAAFRRIAAWIEPNTPRPQGARYASE